MHGAGDEAWKWVARRLVLREKVSLDVVIGDKYDGD